MNIIKLKDIIMPDTEPQSTFFNEFLKGKYAYWVQMRYVVPIGLHEFDGRRVGMKHEGYVACEEDIRKLLMKEDGTYPKPYGSECIDVYNIIHYVDTIETDKANSIMEFEVKNQFSPDADITTDELKKFRTWLATTLLSMDKNDKGEVMKLIFDDSQIHVLNYYINGMFDSTIKILTEFGATELKFTDTLNDSSCGCSHMNHNLSTLYGTSIAVCDPISIYKKNIYEKMIQMFSNIEFWAQWSPEFIFEFKKYIDNIVKLNLPFAHLMSDKFSDCDCIDNSSQEEAMDILKRLSVALNYIYNGQIVGHKNYITSALTDWSAVLYESMEW
jgi:hypothetical protein